MKDGYFLLVCAVGMCSTAGICFAYLNSLGAPPALATSWRFAWTEIFLFVPFLFELRRMVQNQQTTVNTKTKDSILIHDGTVLDDDDEDGTTAATEESRLLGVVSEEGNTVTTITAIQSTASNTAMSPTNEDEHDLVTLQDVFELIPSMVLSGICLGITVVAWIYALKTTSFTQATLFITASPLVITGCSWVFYFLPPVVWEMVTSGCCGSSNHESNGQSTNTKRRHERQHPSARATIGTLVGFSGQLIIIAGVGVMQHSQHYHHHQQQQQQHQHVPTITGDLVAFFGACTVTGYLLLGERVLSRKIPLLVYLFVLDLAAYMTTLTIALLSGEDAGLILGFLEPPFLWYAAFIGLVPSTCGHAALNYLVHHLSPLVVATFMLSEPLVASIMAYVAGFQGIPGWTTWAGGSILILGLYVVTTDNTKTSTT